MMKRAGIIVVGLIVVALLLVSTVTYTVPSTDKAMVLTFGKETRELNGANPDEAGLHFKWPWPIQRLVSYDGRTFMFESGIEQFQTKGDRQNMLATVYCAWRIEDAAKFYRSKETREAGEMALRELLKDIQGNVLGSHPMSDYVNTDLEKIKLRQIEHEMQTEMQESALKEYGVEIVMVGIKSLALPEDVTAAVIRQMIAERRRFITRYEGEGAARATAIRERAKAAKDKIVSFASRRAIDIETRGQEAAAEYYKTYDQNESLSIYLRWLESMRITLKDRTVMVIDPSWMFPLRYFSQDIVLPPTMSIRSGNDDKNKSSR